MKRTAPHLRSPKDVTGFPRRTIRAGTTIYRSHDTLGPDGSPRSPWWFASGPANPEDGGRFDLEAPRGTCYVALDIVTPLRERFGPEILDAGGVPEAAVARTTISRMLTQEDVDAADTADDLAANWVDRELVTIGDYALTWEWAEAFADGGCGGVLYQSRFTTGERAGGLALFGDAGGRAWPVEGTEDVRALLAGAGVKVLTPPSSRTVKLAEPPPMP